MIRLDSTLRKLRIVLSAATTTSALPIVVCWSDKTATAYTGSATTSLSTGVTAVDIVAAPAAATVRDIDFISIFNADTVPATVSVIYSDNSVTSILTQITLAIGSTLKYTHAGGWQSTDKNGATTAAASSSNLTGPISSTSGITSITAQTGTGTTFVVQTSPTLITPNIGVATGTSLTTTTINATGTLTFQSAGTTYGQLAAGGNWSFGGAAGAGESLRVPVIASAVNYFQLNGGAAGNSVQMYSNGASANISIDYITKGLGYHTFYFNNSSPSFQIGPATSGVNYNVFSPSATGGSLVWQAAGADASINMTIQPKGTGVLKVDCGASGAAAQFQVASTGVAGANILLSGNGATTPSKSIRAQAGNLEFINSAYSAVIMSLQDSGRLVLTSPLALASYTVATLPAGNQGDTAYVTNALGPTYGAAVVGGGTVVNLVFKNATTWVCA